MNCHEGSFLPPYIKCCVCGEDVKGNMVSASPRKRMHHACVGDFLRSKAGRDAAGGKRNQDRIAARTANA